MRTIKKIRSQDKTDGYFENLPKSTQEIVKERILDAAENRHGPEGWKSDAECVEDIECQSRDGFIPFNHNRGGLVYQNFTDLMAYWGGGYTCAHEGAAKEIQRCIDLNLDEYIPDAMAEIIGESNMEKYFSGDKSKLNYGDLNQLACTLEKQGHTESADEVFKWVNKIQDLEHDYLSGESESIMHEIRVMYHGQDSNGMHSASVSAAVNTEGPYHRSHISWAPNVFCEGAKEVEVSWKTNAELKRVLTKALATVSKAVF